MKKKNIYIILAIIIVLALILIFSGPKTTPGGEISEETLLEQIEEEDGIFIPSPGDVSEAEGLGIPKGFSKRDDGNDYRNFPIVLKDGILSSFEFRARLGDAIGLVITNLDEEEHKTYFLTSITGDQINVTMGPGQKGMFFIEAEKVGTFDIYCSTCPDSIIGKIVVVE